MSRYSIVLGKILPRSPKLPNSLGPRTIVVGKPGSGKTTLLINDAIKDLNTGITKVLLCNPSIKIFDEKLNKNFLIAGALLHDVGKLLEYRIKDGKVMLDSNFFTGNLNGIEIDGGL